MRNPQHDDDDDDDGALTTRGEQRRLEIARKRARIRLVQVAVYAGMAIALPIGWAQFATKTGQVDILAYLFSGYCALRALAVFIRYRQETAPARYTQDYIEANDLFPPEPDPSAEKKKDHDIQ